MADQQGKNGKPRKPGVLPDMEWTRKRRDDAPVFNRSKPENPFIRVLNGQPEVAPSEPVEEKAGNAADQR